MHLNRHFLFRHYWWIGPSAGVIGCILALIFAAEDRIGLIGAIIASTLGFCYFTQQQKLAETELFYKLFTNFNQRYDKLNDDLSSIASQKLVPSDEQKNKIVDYFNLCAEEYLFFKEGYIPIDVWRAWCRGMSWYLRRHPFKDIWNEEIGSDSFYGLSLDIIRIGAS